MSFKCNICGSVKKLSLHNKVKGYDTAKYYSIVACKSCNTVQTYPFPSDKELTEYYGEQSIAYNGNGGDQFINDYINNKSGYWDKLNLRSRLAEINLYAPNAKSVLDIGCGAGLYIDYLRSKGFKVQGIELSEWGYKSATKKLGLKVHNTPLRKSTIKTNSIDVITMYDLLEHTRSPLLELKHIKKLLGDDGLLIINVPNFDSFISNKTGSQWNKLIPPNHLYHFTTDSLTNILNKSGFKIISIATNNGDAKEFNGELFASLISSTLGIIYPQIKKSYNQRFTPLERESIVAYKIIRAAQKLGEMLWFMAVPFMMILNKMNKGEGIHIIASK